jgi:hypothetical protein
MIRIVLHLLVGRPWLWFTCVFFCRGNSLSCFLLLCFLAPVRGGEEAGVFIRELEAQSVQFLGGQAVLNGSYEYLFERSTLRFSVVVSTKVDSDKAIAPKDYMLNTPSSSWRLKTLDQESRILATVLKKGISRVGLLEEEGRQLDLLSDFFLSGRAYDSQALLASVNPLVHSIRSLRRGELIKVLRRVEKDDSWLLMGDNLRLKIQARTEALGFLYEDKGQWVFRSAFTSEPNLSELILRAIETYRAGVLSQDASMFSGFWGDFNNPRDITRLLGEADELSVRIRAKIP